MRFTRLCHGLNDKGSLFPADQALDNVNDANSDWYTSLYYYNDAHFKRFKELGTVAGIDDVVTDKLFFDFDSKNDLEAARMDAIELCQRLQKEGVAKTAIQVFFSGHKGFAVQVDLDQELTPDVLREVCINKFGARLQTLDLSCYNAARIIRVPGTKHQESQLFRIPLSLHDLELKSVATIKDMASKENFNNDFQWTTAHLPEKLLHLPPKLIVAREASGDITDIDFTNKVKGWTNCKWALMNGAFKDGIRNQAITAIVATCRGLNYPKKQAYYTAKSASKESVERYSGDEYSKEDIWKIVESVYGPLWRGGQYSCKDGKSPWLTSICNSLGSHKCADTESTVVDMSQVFNLFDNYALNFEKNIIKTGIDSLDEKCNFLVGTSNAILAAPSSGKTSLTLSILNHNSKAGIQSVFFSYDMFHSMVYLRLVQKHTGISQAKIFDIFKHDRRKAAEIKAQIEAEYKNVKFCFKSGQTSDEIYETILDTEQKLGEKVKLAMVDYSELVMTPNTSDPTQASAIVAQRMRQIANDAGVCTVTLLQPSKVFSNPAEEITTFQGAKGSGAIAQSVSLMLSMSRPGFNPRNPEFDKFMTINALKYRQGGLFSLDLAWNGLQGSIREMTNEEEIELRQIRDKKAMEKEADGKSGW